MFSSIALVALGVLLLVAGGEALLRGAVGFATLCRMTPAVIGLTIVAAGTSVPELAVSGIAAANGQTDIAIANVVGSNIFNATVILGLCAIIRPMPIVGNTLRLEYPALASATILGVLVCLDGVIDRWEGAFLLAVYVGFNVYLVRIVRAQVLASEAAALTVEVGELKPTPTPRHWVSAMFLVAGIVLLGGGAHATVSGAVGIARLLGLSDRIIGLTIVSIGTGLPEVVASLISSVRGRSDVAIGNVIGSNIFNLLVILGVCSAVAPLAVPQAIAANDVWWMVGVTALLLPLMVRGLRVNRWEGGLLIVVYGAYLWFLLTDS
jgi:cation:H+ antiporter